MSHTEAPANAVETSHTTFHDLPPRAVFAAMVGVGIAMFMAALDQTVVGTAMPRIISELHGFEHYSSIITAYMVASTAVLPIAGKLSDEYGRKNFLLLGVAWFILASMLCGQAHSMLQLAIFRGLQGIGAGVMQTMAFTTIADLYPPAKRGRLMGLMAAVFGFSSVVGPLIGGYLTDGPGWRYTFYVNIPVGIIALVILSYFFPRVRPQPDPNFKVDYKGSLSLLASIVPLLLALTWGGRDYAWTSPLILVLLSSALVFGGGFFWVEGRAPHPILRLELFRNSIVSISMVCASLTMAAMFGATLFIPLFVQSVLGTSATRSGQVLMPLTIALLVTATLSGLGISRTGRYRPFAIVGVGLSAVGVFLLSLMTADTSYVTLIRNIIITGMGLGMVMPVFNLSVQNAVDVRIVGSATSMVQFMRAIGGTLGVALFGAVLAGGFAPAFHQALPADLTAHFTPGQMSAIDSPQSYMRPEGMQVIESKLREFGLYSSETVASLHSAAKVALTASIHSVFFIAAILLFFTTFLTLFLKEIPLRKSNKPETPSLAH